jgi:hypothetical protein
MGSEDASTGLNDACLQKFNSCMQELTKLQRDLSQIESSERAMSFHFNLSAEHFHAMISYRVATEGGVSGFAGNLYQQLTSNKPNMSQIDRHVPLGKFPDYVKYDGWLIHDPGIRKEINSGYRFFLDSVRLRDGYDWRKAFSRAVCNSILFIPILSCHKVTNEEEGGETKYAGSVGNMIGWDPDKKDWVDNVLLEIGMANVLMELPQEERWLNCIVPVFLGEKKNKGFQRFNFQVVNLLSSKPSLETNREVALRLIENGYPLEEEVLSRILKRSIRDIIKPLFDLQGIIMSDLGSER